MQNKARKETGGMGGFVFEFKNALGNPLKEITKKFTKFKDKHLKFGKMREKLSKISFGALSKVGKVMGMALKFSLYFILFIVGAFLIFAVIKKLFSNAEVMTTVMETLSGIFEGVKMTLSGFVDIFSVFFGEGTFGEKLKTLIGGFGKIFGGLGKILWSVTLGILKLGFKLIVAFVELWLKLIIFIFSNFGKKEFWQEKVINPVKDWYKNTLKPALVSYFMDKWKSIKDLPSDLWTKWLKPKLWDPLIKILITPFMLIFKKIAGWFGVDTSKYASGGISSGGLAMVGERGPELVNLPRGAKVNTAQNTERMLGGISNTINVSVNGRVGASDSELRDIAKKIGRMVSAEINRSTSSSTNLRY
jgi:hypothetical protein